MDGWKSALYVIKFALLQMLSEMLWRLLVFLNDHNFVPSFIGGGPLLLSGQNERLANCPSNTTVNQFSLRCKLHSVLTAFDGVSGAKNLKGLVRFCNVF